MFNTQFKLLVAIFFASALSAEPLVHDHHDHDEAVITECLACENGFSSEVTDPTKETFGLPFSIKNVSIAQKIESIEVPISNSRAPPKI